jgi:hypothetical protein
MDDVDNSVEGIFKPSSNWRDAADNQVIKGIFLTKSNKYCSNATLPTEILNSLKITEIDESAYLPVIAKLNADEKTVTVVSLEIDLPAKFEATISRLSIAKKRDGKPFLKGLASIKEGVRSHLSIFIPYADRITVTPSDKGFVTAIVNFKKDDKNYPFVSSIILSGTTNPDVPNSALQFCKELSKDDDHGIFKVEFTKTSGTEPDGYNEVHISIGPVIITSYLSEDDWKSWQDNLDSFRTRLSYTERTTFYLPLNLNIYKNNLTLALSRTLFKKIAKDSTFSFVAEATYEDRVIYWMKEAYTGIEVGVLRSEFLLHGVSGFNSQTNVEMSLLRADDIAKHEADEGDEPFVNWKNAWHIEHLPIDFEVDASVRQQPTSATTLFNWSNAYADTDFEEEQIKKFVPDADTSMWLRLKTSAPVSPVVRVNGAIIDSLYPIKANTDCTADIRIHFLEEFWCLESGRFISDSHPQWLSAVSVAFDHTKLHPSSDLATESLVIKQIDTSLSRKGNTKYTLILEHHHKHPVSVAPYEVAESWLPVLAEKDWTGYRCVATVSQRQDKLIVKRIERLEVNE